MKKLRMGMACLAIAGLGLIAAGEANAVVAEGRTYVFYSGTQIIGQSMLFCSNDQKHWGQASRYNLNNAVSISYSCTDGTAIHIGYPANIDPWLKANFCAETVVCETGPWPVTGAPALENLLYSD